MNSDVMIDIETMSTANDALVLSIGARKFTAASGLLLDPGLLVVPSFFEQVLKGRRIDRSTQLWWGDPQRAKAAEHWMAPARVMTVRTALVELGDYVKGCTRFWARGTHFDIAILDSLHQDFELKSPWPYNAPRDVRSFTEQRDRIRVSEDTVVEELPAHHPFEDCRVQIADLWEHGLV